MHPLLDAVHNLLVAVVRVIQKRKAFKKRNFSGLPLLSFSGSLINVLTVIYKVNKINIL
jgi:hypothetical protein